MGERMDILRQIEAGEISVEEGARRLEALAGPPSESAEMRGALLPPVSRPALVRWLWQIVFSIGAILVGWGGYLLVSFYTQEVPTRWLTWGWILFVLGALGIWLGWWLQQAHWFSVRVREPHGPQINIAAPLPLGLIAWIVRLVRPFVPQVREMEIDELLLALQREMKEGQPFLVEVNEGEKGEQVQVYFG